MKDGVEVGKLDGGTDRDGDDVGVKRFSLWMICTRRGFASRGCGPAFSSQTTTPEKSPLRRTLASWESTSRTVPPTVAASRVRAVRSVQTTTRVNSRSLGGWAPWPAAGPWPALQSCPPHQGWPGGQPRARGPTLQAAG